MLHNELQGQNYFEIFFTIADTVAVTVEWVFQSLFLWNTVKHAYIEVPGTGFFTSL